MMKSIWPILTVLLIQSCSDDEQGIREAAIIEYELKVEELRRQKQEECRTEAIRVAENYVDSIILSLDIKPMPDSLYQPNVPPKPEFVPVDSAVFKRIE